MSSIVPIRLENSFTYFSVVGSFLSDGPKDCDSIRNPFNYSRNWCFRNMKRICNFPMAPFDTEKMTPVEPRVTLGFLDDSVSSAIWVQFGT